jgi:phosphoribosyl 1,2-cyclic phosphodiesterase
MERLGTDFQGCDLLVINCIKPEADRYGGHLWSGEAIKVLRVAKPKKAVITHLGMKMMKIGPAKEAERIGKEAGVETIAAKDGMRIAV